MHKNIEVDYLIREAITEEELKEIYQEFHRYPEVSNHEFETMKRIVKLLETWDIPFRSGVGGTGIVAELAGNRPGKTIALRADIDALPVEEKSQCAFASENSGVMHACGHDAHTTVLLGVAKTLRSLNGQFAGNFVFLFQPDEEDTGGAQRMIAEGCLEHPKVDHVLGLHVSSDIPVGSIGIKYGKMYAASDMFTLKVYGRSSHGARPNEGIDAIVIAAHIIASAQTIVSRNTNPTDSAVCTFGKIQGGAVRNQIAEYVECHGILRTLTPDSRERVRAQLENICKLTAQAMSGKAELEIIPSYGPLINDDGLTGVLRAVAQKQLGEDHIVLEDVPQLGVEDFSYYAALRPSVFYHLGCANPDGSTAPLHNSSFLPDQDCLMVGVRLQTELALTLVDDEK